MARFAITHERMPRLHNKVAIITFVPPSSVMRKEVGIHFRATPRLSADSAGILRFEEEASPGCRLARQPNERISTQIDAALRI